MQSRCPKCGIDLDLPPKEESPVLRVKCRCCGAVLERRKSNLRDNDEGRVIPAGASVEGDKKRGGVRRTSRAGMSAIRAQSIRSDSPGAADESRGAAETEQVSHIGWMLRIEGGETYHFRDLRSVRGWIAANPEARVQLSSDGRDWRSPDEIVGIEREAAVYDSSLEPDPRDGGTPEPRRVGWGWMTAALLSTMPVVILAFITLHNLEAVNLAGQTWLDSSAAARFMRDHSVTEVAQQRPPSTEEIYFEALKEGDEAREQGRLLEAIAAYQTALQAMESTEVLEALASSYEDMGDMTRAERVARRLTEIETKKDDELQQEDG